MDIRLGEKNFPAADQKTSICLLVFVKAKVMIPLKQYKVS
jgi:hypothetical protein